MEINSPTDGYNKIARYYDDWYWQKFWIKNELPIILRIIEREEGLKHILDIGCGTATYLNHIKDLVPDALLYGIDTSSEILEVARKKLSGHNNTSVFKCYSGADEWGFCQKFELVLMNRVGTHMNRKDLQNTFNNVGKNLKCGSKFIVSDVSSLHQYDYTRIPGFNDKKVYIETYKHTKRTWESVANNAKLELSLQEMIPDSKGNIVGEVYVFSK